MAKYFESGLRVLAGTSVSFASVFAQAGSDGASGGTELALTAPAVRGVRIDGALDEWVGTTPTLVLDSASQVWSQRATGVVWNGVDDLSARVWVGHDPAHVYVAGSVRDDSFVAGSLERLWHQQDAIEIFFDLRSDRAEPSLEASIQLFVMPFSTERRWGQIDWPSNRPTGSSLIGVRAETRRGEGEYTFELVLPFCNFAEFQPGTTSIGFDLAIDDHDVGTTRYQYVTATGENPTQEQRLFCALDFAGVSQAGSASADRSVGGGVLDWIRSNATYLLLPVLGVLALVALLRGWGALEAASPRLRPIARVAGAVLFLAGLVLPGWLVESRHSEFDGELRGVVETLQTNIEEFEQGVLGGYGGEERDRAFAQLLEGEAIAREQRYSYTEMRDLLGSEAMAPSAIDLGFTVMPYGIPLGLDSTERFEFRDPLPPGILNVVVSRPHVPSFDPDFDERPPVSMLATQIGLDDEVVSERIEFADVLETTAPLVSEGVEVSFRTVAIEREIRAVTIAEVVGDGVELVGLTWASSDRTEERPLSLGEASLGGIETDLRGAAPRDAGFEITPNSNYSIEIPAGAVDAAFDKLWMFYRATYPGRPTLTRPGDTVCEVRLWQRGRDEARLIEFRHQESMFFELELQNLDVPEGSDVAVGLRWQDEDQEAHINIVREFDLGEDLARLEFRNVGPYSIRFRSIVFGRGVRNVAVSRSDSPLESAGAPGAERLRPRFLDQIGGAKVALYRAGRLTASTLGATGGEALTDLPADVRRASLDEAVYLRAPAGEDATEHRAFALLGGDWGGAVLGVFLRDSGSGLYSQWVHRIGALLSLLSIPVLLHLFSQALAVLGSLRLRLIAVFALVMLVPLGLLSVVLVGVLEGGYEDDLRARLERSVDAATRALRDERKELRAAALRWARDLADQLGSDLTGGGVDAALLSTMASQRPPAWDEDGGFLLFEFDPRADADQPPPARSVFLGPDELRALSTPLRTEPGLYLAWSVPLIGVRAEVELPAGTCTLSVGRRLDAEFLQALAGDRTSVLLCGVNGYPLNITSGSGIERAGLGWHGLEPATIRSRAEASDAVLAGGEPILRHHAAGSEDWVAMYDVLRDLQGTPRALLGLLEPYEGARLPLSMGRVPVRGFFLTTAVLLVVASLFLGWVVTTRISRPMERLERGAKALSRGELDVRIDVEEGGQIGQLTRTFNRMAEELRGRIQDLDLLNRGIRELTSRLDISEVLASAIAFYVRQTPAHRVRILLRDRARERIDVFGGESNVTADAEAPDVTAVLSSAGPHSLRLDPAEGRLGGLFPGCQSAIVLPLAIGGRTRGAVLLLFEAAVPEPINLELHATMAVQVTAAIENAWLYRHAVEDLYTGAHRPEFFSNRVARAIGDAESRGEDVVLLGFRLSDGVAIAESFGDERHGRFLESLFDVLRHELGTDAVLCRARDDELQAMVVGRGRDAARRACESIAAGLVGAAGALPPRFRPLGLVHGFAAFPENAASAEFLFDALARRLERGETRSAPASQLELKQLPADGMLLESPAMEGVLRTLRRFAPTDISLLLEGETGVGKEMLTNVVHAWSKRASGPLVKVHCAALPSTLLQSELFGHEKGAFTGAHERSVGRFEQADGGTIFLDEIGEISLDVQVQLLRVLQEREIERVGGGKPIPVDVRIIAATNRDLREMVAAGTFREDLYYRLQGMVVVVPSLRERKQEIPQLIEHFRREAVAAGHTQVEGFSTEALDELFRRDWPGNIRELRNTVARALVLASGERVTRADLAGETAEPDRESGSESRHGEVAVDVSPDSHRATPAPAEDSVILPRPEEPIAEVPTASEPRAEVFADESSADAKLDLAEIAATVPPRLRTAIALLRQRESMSSTEYASIAGVSARTALRDLNRLVELGLLLRDGKRRGARYRLSEVANSVDPPGQG